MEIPNSIQAAISTTTPEPLNRPQQPAGEGSHFAGLIEGLLENSEAMQDQIGTEVQKIMEGESSSLHEVSLAVANADLSFRFMMQLRDQLIQTYREVMRMQV